MSNKKENYLIYGLASGVGVTTLSIMLANRLMSQDRTRKLCLIVDDKERKEELEKLNLSYPVLLLSEELEIPNDLTHLVFSISNIKGKNKLLLKMPSKKYVVLEATRTQANRLNEHLKDVDIDSKIVVNKLLTNRKSQCDVFNQVFSGFSFIKNRQGYEYVLNGVDPFKPNVNIAGQKNMIREFNKVFDLE